MLNKVNPYRKCESCQKLIVYSEHDCPAGWLPNARDLIRRVEFELSILKEMLDDKEVMAVIRERFGYQFVDSMPEAALEMHWEAKLAREGFTPGARPRNRSENT